MGRKFGVEKGVCRSFISRRLYCGDSSSARADAEETELERAEVESLIQKQVSDSAVRSTAITGDSFGGVFSSAIWWLSTVRIRYLMG